MEAYHGFVKEPESLETGVSQDSSQ
jgi:hypothetical protein